MSIAKPQPQAHHLTPKAHWQPLSLSAPNTLQTSTRQGRCEMCEEGEIRRKKKRKKKKKQKTTTKKQMFVQNRHG